MNCKDIQKVLQNRFDDGVDLRTGFESHLVACEDCGNILEGLERLNASLMELPIVAPDALADRIKLAVAHERRPTFRPGLVAAASIAMLALTAVTNWFVPVLSFVESGWTQLAGRLPENQWLKPGPPIMSQIEAGYADVLGRLDGLYQYSQPTTWIALAIALTVVLALNGIEAAWLGSAHDGHHSE